MRLVTWLPKPGSFSKCVLGEGWQCRLVIIDHAFDFVARRSDVRGKRSESDGTGNKLVSFECAGPDLKLLEKAQVSSLEWKMLNSFRRKKILSCKKQVKRLSKGKKHARRSISRYHVYVSCRPQIKLYMNLCRCFIFFFNFRFSFKC